MAEQNPRPPDLSPTEMPQPIVAPAGRYTLTSFTGRYSIGYQPSDAPTTTPQTQPSIEDLLKGVWRPSGPRDMVQGMFDDRLKVQTLELGDVLSQISERIEIYKRHFDQLEQAKLDVKNVRHHWTDPLGRLGEVADPELVSALQDLDAQQRQERLSCWKDLANLRQRVPEHWRHYLAAVRQDQLIGPQEPGVQKDE